MHNNLISIITPSFNCQDTILFTYESIKSQTYENWEWVITDDCSSDKSVELIENIIRKDKRVILLKNQTNLGAAKSRNSAIKKASGSYIAFIDSDDLWVSNKLETQLDFMINKNVGFSFSSYELIDKNGSSLNKFVDIQNKTEFSYRDMLFKRATLGCSTVMLKKSILQGKLMPNIRTGQDYAFWLTILKEGNTAHLINESLTKYRILPNSISRNKVKKALRQWEIYRDLEGLPLLLSFLCFSSYAINAVFRK